LLREYSVNIKYGFSAYQRRKPMNRVLNLFAAAEWRQTGSDLIIDILEDVPGHEKKTYQ
jgi:hypothetical protein